MPAPAKVWLEFDGNTVHELAHWLVQKYNLALDLVEYERKDAGDKDYIEWMVYELAMIGLLLGPVRRMLGPEFEGIATVECTWPAAEGAPPTLHEDRLREVLEVSSGVST